MAQRQPTWRLSGAEAVYVAPGADHRQRLQASTGDVRDTCGSRYLPLRESPCDYTDDLAAVLSPGYRHDTFQP